MTLCIQNLKQDKLTKKIQPFRFKLKDCIFIIMETWGTIELR